MKFLRVRGLKGVKGEFFLMFQLHYDESKIMRGCVVTDIEDAIGSLRRLKKHSLTPRR